MAIDSGTTTSYADLYKEIYGDTVTALFDKATVTYNQFPKADAKYSVRGKGFNEALQIANSASNGSRGEQKMLPPGLAGKSDVAKILPKFHYHALQMSGPAMEAGKGDVAAYVDLQTAEIKGAYEETLVQLNRQSWGDGYGLLGTLSAVSDAVTTSGSTTWTVTMDNATGVQYCRPGMLVDFYNSTAIDESATACRISSVNPMTKSLEMEPNDSTYLAYHPLTAARSYTITTGTVASGSYMVTMGSRAATHATTNTSYELDGLPAIYDDGTLRSTFEGITVSGNPYWQATILDNSSVTRALTIDLMLSAIQAAKTRGGRDIAKIRMGLGQQRNYAGLLLNDVRFQPQVIKGGYTTMTFAAGGGDIEMVIDPYATAGAIYFEPADCIKKYESLPLGFGNLDPEWKQVTQYDEYQKFLKIYCNLGTAERHGLVLLKDLTEPTLFT